MLGSGLCATCLHPGACCNDIFLSGGGFEDSMSFDTAEHKALSYGMPFRPLAQHENGQWRWWCTNLGSDGRCTDYDNRPQLCRDYTEGHDRLCVHYVEPTDGDA